MRESSRHKGEAFDNALGSILRHTEDLTEFIENYPDMHLYHMLFAVAEVAEILATSLTVKGEDGRKEVDKAIQLVRGGCDQGKEIN